MDKTPVDSQMLSILQWNCRGIRNKLEFKQLLADKQYHIVCIQESMLTDKHKYTVSGYNTVRKDRTLSKGGGLLTLIRSDIKYQTVDLSTYAEALIVKIISNGKSIHIANTYLPPSTKVNKDSLKPLFELKTCIIAGDLNAKHTLWNSPINDAAGLIIEELINEYNCVVLNNGQSTHTHINKSSVIQTHIDVTVTNDLTIASKSNWYALNNCMASDHNPILLTINEVDYQPADTAINGWNLKKANWDAFTIGLQNIHPTEEDYDINELNKHIVDIINQIASTSIPVKKASNINSRIKPLIYWNDDIKTALKERNKSRNYMLRHRNLASIIDYKRLKAKAQNIIKKSAKQHWQNYCSSITTSTKLNNVWTMLKRMQGVTSSNLNHPIIQDGVTYTEDQEKANILADHFARVSSSDNYNSDFIDVKDDIESNHAYAFQNDNAGDHNLNCNFSMHELKNTLASIKRNTAPGEDQIPYEILKHLPTSFLNRILTLYNMVWQTGAIPDTWKHSIVIPILKQGKDPTSTNSYRPISLTNTIAKLMEHMVTKRLNWYLESNHLLNNVQSGFRQNHSTIEHIIKLQDTINKSINNKGHTLSIFLDFEKAFDMVWRNGILIKLKHMGIQGCIYNYIADFLSDRTMQVRINSRFSDIKIIENGVIQGSVISPLLFLVIINDLPNKLTQVETSLFADDCSVFKSGKSLKHTQKHIQAALNEITNWCTSNGFKISVDKSVAVLFTRKNNQHIKLNVNGTPLKVDSKAKFLGLIFDKNLKWKDHIDYIASKAKKRLNLLRVLTGTEWGASKSCMITIYKTLIRSLFDYGCEAYSSCHPRQFKKLVTIQNMALRLCTGAMRGTNTQSLEVDTGVPPLELRTFKYLANTANRALASPNSTVSSVFKDHWSIHYNRYKQYNLPIYAKLQEYIDHYREEDYTGPVPSEVPPWLRKTITIDLALTKEVSKHEDPTTLLHLAKQHIASYRNSHLISYTDASKAANGRTGLGCFIPQSPAYNQHSYISKRLTDNISIYAAELSAIHYSIDQFREIEHTTQQTFNFIIFSDSLSCIQSLQSNKSTSRPNLFNALHDSLTHLKSPLTISWLPSHIGIEGNEVADQLANAATKQNHIDINIPLELSESHYSVDNYIHIKWQEQWDKCNTLYRLLQPDVSTVIKFKHENPRTERLINRLRLGKSYLNNYLHQYNKTINKNCTTCNTPETITHYLTECNTILTQQLNHYLTNNQLPLNVPTILNNTICVQIIAQYATRKL